MGQWCIYLIVLWVQSLSSVRDIKGNLNVAITTEDNYRNVVN